jgi:hypothetical protein
MTGNNEIRTGSICDPVSSGFPVPQKLQYDLRSLISFIILILKYCNAARK